MNKAFYISKWLVIENKQVVFNDELLLTTETQDLDAFAKEVYRFLKLDYPKFFKMDGLSKWAILGAELVLQHETSKDIALLFSNASASAVTDAKHALSIQSADDYYPSPSVFVYTLPNISIGEVSIKHQLLTESVFLVHSTYDSSTMHNYATYLLQQQKAEKIMCGWVENLNNTFKLVLYLVESSGLRPHTIQEINKIVR